MEWFLHNSNCRHERVKFYTGFTYLMLHFIYYNHICQRRGFGEDHKKTKTKVKRNFHVKKSKILSHGDEA